MTRIKRLHVQTLMTLSDFDSTIAYSIDKQIGYH